MTYYDKNAQTKNAEGYIFLSFYKMTATQIFK